jgi:hypothetical protein
MVATPCRLRHDGDVQRAPDKPPVLKRSEPDVNRSRPAAGGQKRGEATARNELGRGCIGHIDIGQPAQRRECSKLRLEAEKDLIDDRWRRADVLRIRIQPQRSAQD